MENKSCWIIILWIVSLVYVQGQDEACYTMSFDGESFLIFNHEFEHRNRLDLSLSFSTSQDDGVIYYKEGNYDEEDGAYDFEALYIRNSTLNYFVFNPKVTGTGTSFGCHVKTDFNVSNATWFEVEFFRNKEVEEKNENDETETVTKTGMIVNGNSFLVEDYMSRIGELELDALTYIGGYRNMERLKIDRFDGEIKNLRDVTDQNAFPKPPVAMGPGKDDIVSDCLEFPVPS